MNKPVIQVSVRNMIEFLLRSGDIAAGIASPQLLLQGTLAHRRVQAAAEEGYVSEVRLSCQLEFDKFILLVEGIADGIIPSPEQPVVDEIKSTSVPLDLIREDYNPLHWAQAKCYGWMYLSQEGGSSAVIRLTYSHRETKEIRQFTKVCSYDELKAYFSSLAEQYAGWIGLDLDHREKRNSSIHSLDFPFPQYRKGQRRMAESTYQAVRNGRLLFIHAPTGIGKTVSVLYPALKALGEGLAQKIFYLTAKAVTRQVAEETLRIMQEKGLVIRSVTLTAKEKLCLQDMPHCDGENCPFARGHYDRVNAALKDILLSESIITRELVLKYAERHRVCPHEFSLDICEWADVVICDYNHAFDPRAYLRRFFDAGGDYVLLVDEAHNLAERARDMYSADLSKQSFMPYRKFWKQSEPLLYKKFQAVNKWFTAMRKSLDDGSNFRVIEFPEDLISSVKDFTYELEAFISLNRSSLPDKTTDLYYECKAFLAAAGFFDERYAAYVYRRGSDVTVRLLCADPSFLLRKAYDKNRSAVFFSGTLQPMAFYKEILGGSPDDEALCLPSPFRQENFCLMISGRISTRYRDREYSFRGIAEYIKAAVSQRPGNYLVYFPSFEYLNNVLDFYRKTWPEDYIIVQRIRMDDDDRKKFLEAFDDAPGKTMIAFAVMGGIFAEGIDLAGDRLSGAVVVGVGLPQLSVERDLIAEYYKKVNGRGFEYAYMLPGLNRVMQAAGRVIRTENDRGFVLLLDDRFLQKRYLQQFPAEWQHYANVASPEQAAEVLAEFWAQNEG
jgi:Rad3-related DNA helicase